MLPTLVYTHGHVCFMTPGPGTLNGRARIGGGDAGRSAGVARSTCGSHRSPPKTISPGPRPSYIDAISRMCASGEGCSIPTPPWSRARGRPRCAAGAGLAAATAIQAGESRTVSGSASPVITPTRRASGFCLFNNVAMLAENLTRQGQRVAIVDWDVHHGDGTQDTFYHREGRALRLAPRVSVLSEERVGRRRGSGEGMGHTVNVALPPGTRGDAYDLAFTRIVIPVLGEFAPDWILVSAGYDAHRRSTRRHRTRGSRLREDGGASGFDHRPWWFSKAGTTSSDRGIRRRNPRRSRRYHAGKHRPVHLTHAHQMVELAAEVAGIHWGRVIA